MQRHVRKVATYAGLSLALALGFNNCSKAAFSQSSSSYGGFSVLQDGTRAYDVQMQLTNRQTMPLDIVWVVDNSGSMSTEAAHVRTNLDAFVAQLMAVPDVKLALINKVGTTDQNVRLPATQIPHLELNQTVDSNNALQILSAALCPASPLTSSVCGSAAVRSQISPYSAVAGKLASFLRADSRKVFVLVTDDRSTMSAAQFRSVYGSLYAADTMVAFGWIGLGAAASPCQAATGTQYQDLAQATGGDMNNVCDANWSAKFAELAQNVVTLALDTIPLPADVINASQILRVTLNGRELSSKDYSIGSSGLVLSASARSGVSLAQVRIVFKD